VKLMSLEAIKNVTLVEEEIRARKVAVETEARRLIADAERNGLALLQQVRADAAENSRAMLKQAEENAAAQAEKIAEAAKADSLALQEQAEKRLHEAAEFIVGRVVKN